MGKGTGRRDLTENVTPSKLQPWLIKPSEERHVLNVDRGLTGYG